MGSRVRLCVVLFNCPAFKGRAIEGHILIGFSPKLLHLTIANQNSHLLPGFKPRQLAQNIRILLKIISLLQA
jgi:hypothetical protein